MTARSSDYGIVSSETDWTKVLLSKPLAAARQSIAPWETAVSERGASCESTSLGASISTQVDVLSTFVKIVDERDSRSLAAAASRIKETEQLAEARLRYALNLDGNSSRAPKAPPWLEGMRAHLDGCLPAAVTAVGQLLALLSSKIDVDSSTIDVQPGPDGAVVVALGAGCRWFVAPARLPWPGCDVRFYSPESPNSLKLRAEHHRLVTTLFEATLPHLKRDAG